MGAAVKRNTSVCFLWYVYAGRASEIEELKDLTEQERMLLSHVRTRGYVHHLDASRTYIGAVKLRCHRYGFEVPVAELSSIAMSEGTRPVLQVHLCVGALATKAEQDAAIQKAQKEYLEIRPEVFARAHKWLTDNNSRYSEREGHHMSVPEILREYTCKDGNVVVLKGELKSYGPLRSQKAVLFVHCFTLCFNSVVWYVSAKTLPNGSHIILTDYILVVKQVV